MFLIVLAHVVGTLSLTEPSNLFVKDIQIDLSHSTSNLSTLILSGIRYFGTLGNSIFFICSAWFLLDKEVNSKKKIFNMMADVWLISICFLILSLIFCNELVFGFVSKKVFLSFLFPVLFGNNWYITCYILFCLIYPYLNLIINKLDQRALLKVAIFMTTIYILLNFVGQFLFCNRLIIWIAIYFALAYAKKYLKDLIEKNWLNMLLLMIGVIGNTGLILITNLLGFKITFLSDKLLYWATNGNPFIILIAFSLLNFSRKLTFSNKFINRTSKLTLLIYLFHENYFLKEYIRPMIWTAIFEKFGKAQVVWWSLLFSVALFIASVIVGMIYSNTLQRITKKVSDKIYSILIIIYNKIEKIIFNLH